MKKLFLFSLLFLVIVLGCSRQESIEEANIEQNIDIDYYDDSSYNEPEEQTREYLTASELSTISFERDYEKNKPDGLERDKSSFRLRWYFKEVESSFSKEFELYNGKLTWNIDRKTIDRDGGCTLTKEIKGEGTDNITNLNVYYETGTSVDGTRLETYKLIFRKNFQNKLELIGTILVPVNITTILKVAPNNVCSIGGLGRYTEDVTTTNQKSAIVSFPLSWDVGNYSGTLVDTEPYENDLKLGQTFHGQVINDGILLDTPSAPWIITWDLKLEEFDL